MEEDKNNAKKPDNTELAFKLYDKDKDGFITKSEMSKVSKKLSKDQVDKVMRYTDDDIAKLDEHFQEVCDQQQEFIEWEGPRQDPRLLLASNRGPQTSSKGAFYTNFITNHIDLR